MWLVLASQPARRLHVAAACCMPSALCLACGMPLAPSETSACPACCSCAAATGYAAAAGCAEVPTLPPPPLPPSIAAAAPVHFLMHSYFAAAAEAVTVPSAATDVYAEFKDAQGQPCTRVLKLLSVDPANYPDAPREGIRRVLEAETGVPHPRGQPLDTSRIAAIRMGTTVGLN